MTSVRELEPPAGWARPRRFRRLATATLSLIAGVFLLALGATGGFGSERVNAASAVGFLLVGAGWIAGASATARRLPRPSSAGEVELGRDDDGSAVLSVHRSLSAHVSGLLHRLGLGAGLVVLGVANLSERGFVMGWLVAFGAYQLGTLIDAIRQGRTPTEIRLGPELVRVRAGRRTFSIPWNDLDAVVATETRHERRLALRGRDAAGVEIGAEQFALDPVRLFHLLHHYHAHPHARPELGTPAGLQRLREARFATL
jgi:hypothetical protein